MNHKSTSFCAISFLQLATSGCFGTPADSSDDSSAGPAGSSNVSTSTEAPTTPRVRCTEYPNTVEVQPESATLFVEEGTDFWKKLYYHEGFLFWENEPWETSDGPSLMKAPSDGSGEPQLVHQWDELPVFAGKLHFHGDYVFHRDADGLERLNWRTGVEELVYDEPGMCGTAFRNKETAEDSEYIYYTLRDGGAFCDASSGILRINKDTLVAEKIASEYEKPAFPVVRDNLLYFANQLETDDIHDHEVIRFELDTRVARVLGRIKLYDTYELVPFEDGVVYFVPEDLNYDRPISELWHLTDDGVQTRLPQDFCSIGVPKFFPDNDHLLLFGHRGFSLLSPGDRILKHYPVNVSDNVLIARPLTLGEGSAYHITSEGEIRRTPL